MLYEDREPRPSREPGPSDHARRPSFHALIHPENIGPIRRPSHYRRLFAPKHIKEEEIHGVLAPWPDPANSVRPKRGLKRYSETLETPYRKRVKLSLPTKHATASSKRVVADRKFSNPDATDEKNYFNFWIAHLVLLYVVRVQAEDWPRPHPSPEIVDTFVEDVETVMVRYQMPDHRSIQECLVIHCLWYLQNLSPKGFIDIEDLSTYDGLLAARRLFLLACNFAFKWLFDYEIVRLEKFLPLYDKGFSRSAAKFLEISALEALDHSLYIPPAELYAFQSSLAEWSSRVDIFSPFYDAHRWMAKRLGEVALGTRSRSRIMQGRQKSRPPAFCIDTVHAALLTGLNSLLVKLFPDSPVRP